MPDAHTLSTADLKSLYTARSAAARELQIGLQVRIDRDLGKEPVSEKPEITAIKARLENFLNDTLVTRLMQNDRSVPLLSSDDLDDIVPSLVREMVQDDNVKLSDEIRTTLEGFLKGVFTGIVEAAQGMVVPGKDRYEEHWRWLNMVLEVAARRKLPPTEIIRLQSASDEVTRRLYTRDEYSKLNWSSLEKILNLETLKEIAIKPMFEVMALDLDLDANERSEFGQDFERKCTAELSGMIMKIRATSTAWLYEQTVRIYGDV